MISLDSPLVMVAPQTRYAVSDSELDRGILRAGFGEVWAQLADSPDQDEPDTLLDIGVPVPEGDSEDAVPKAAGSADMDEVKIADRKPAAALLDASQTSNQATETPLASSSEPTTSVELQNMSLPAGRTLDRPIGPLPQYLDSGPGKSDTNVSRTQSTPGQHGPVPAESLAIGPRQTAPSSQAEIGSMPVGGSNGPARARTEIRTDGAVPNVVLGDAKTPALRPHMSFVESVNRSTHLAPLATDGKAPQTAVLAQMRGASSLGQASAWVQPKATTTPIGSNGHTVVEHSTSVRPGSVPRQPAGPTNNATTGAQNNPLRIAPDVFAISKTTHNVPVLEGPSSTSVTPQPVANAPFAMIPPNSAQPVPMAVMPTAQSDQPDVRLTQTSIQTVSAPLMQPESVQTYPVTAQDISPEMGRILSAHSAPVSPEPHDAIMGRRAGAPQATIQIAAPAAQVSPLGFISNVQPVELMQPDMPIDTDHVFNAPTSPTLATNTAAAITAATPPQQPTVAQQITTAIIQSAGRTTEISLNPEELGRVRISLTPADTGMTVTIFSERPETADLMRRNIELLAQEFTDLGYENLSFNFESPDEGDAEDDAHGDPHRTDPVATPTDATPPLTMSVALKGGLDLKL